MDILHLVVDNDTLTDARNIAHSVYAPLRGFLRRADFESVVHTMRLTDGSVWSIPVVLDITAAQYEQLRDARAINLIDENGQVRATLSDVEIYPYDKAKYAQQVFGTTDTEHPGVAAVMAKGDYLVGGEVAWHDVHADDPFAAHYFTPTQTKQLFAERGWKTIVAFQTRNVPHRSHEYLQKLALEKVDGLFINPVIGKKKSGDFRDDVIIDAYQILIEKYHSPERSLLGILPMKMNYAGPREAVHHALIRHNFGCTHMIIGRDHAGVGSYYDPYAAHRIFDEFTPDELGIMIMKFENASFCKQCGDITIQGACEHPDSERVFISGTKMREMIQAGDELPPECMRPEVTAFLLNHDNPFV